MEIMISDEKQNIENLLTQIFPQENHKKHLFMECVFYEAGELQNLERRRKAQVAYDFSDNKRSYRSSDRPLKTIGSRHPKIEVAMMSDYGDWENSNQVILSEPKSFFLKPAKVDALRMKLSNLLNPSLKD